MGNIWPFLAQSVVSRQGKDWLKTIWRPSCWWISSKSNTEAGSNWCDWHCYRKKNAFLTHTNLAHMNVYLNNNLWGSKMKPILRCQNTAVPWMSNWGWLQKSVNTTSFFLHTVTCLFKWRLKVLQATQEWKWIHHVHSPLPMESWVKFCSPQKISGASRQKRLAALF